MSESLRTLIVDDEEGIRVVLKETLERVGHLVTTAASGEEALDQLQETPYDLILLDLMLGGAVTGQRVLEAVRWRWPATVALILTGHGSLESAVEAIREGVDGYLLKPARPEEVRQAVEEAFYRRKKLLEAKEAEASEHLLRRGPFTVDLGSHTAALDDKPLDLSAREMLLLAHLMQNAPQVVPAKDLVAVVRDYRPEHNYEAREIIKWYIHRLRKKVEPDPSRPRHILNVRGVGYRFVE
jgi:DNA-binding response OmpR family regulator